MFIPLVSRATAHGCWRRRKAVNWSLREHQQWLANPRPTNTLPEAAVADEGGDEHHRSEELDQRWDDIPDEYIMLTSSALRFLPATHQIFFELDNA
jgi:hypothetical protein